jgi:hypothetical protein
MEPFSLVRLIYSMFLANPDYHTSPLRQDEGGICLLMPLL